MRVISNYKHEKIGGLRHHKVHFVGGVNQGLMEQAMEQKLEEARGKGYGYFVDPVIIAGLAPDGRVTHEEIDLAGLPEDFDPEKAFNEYIATISLAWEDDYQSFAPLPGGNLGTAQQSQTMADKTRSKGPANFMRMMEHRFNYYGVLPKSVVFHYGEQDPAADMQKLMQMWRYAQALKLLIESGSITTQVAQMMLRDAGYLKADYLTMLGQTDPTPQPVNSDSPVPMPQGRVA